MAIDRPALMLGSLARGPEAPFTVRLPGTNFSGLADGTYSAGDTILFNGPLAYNISTDSKRCNLRVPFAPVLITAASADTMTVSVTGFDHLGRPVTETWVKAGNAQTACCGTVCYSRITNMTILALSNPASRVRVGACYGHWLSTAGDLGTLGGANATGFRSHRRIPLPWAIKNKTDVSSVRFLGLASGASRYIIATPGGSTITYSGGSGVTATTTVVAWDPTAVPGPAVVGDFAYLINGCVGEITAVAANTITVRAWLRNGLQVSPSSPSASFAASTPELWIVRHGMRSTLSFSASVAYGAAPGLDVVPGGATTAGVTADGYDLGASTVGFFPQFSQEPSDDLLFSVTPVQDAVY